MSRSNSEGEKLQHPCKSFMQWAAKKAELSYYDKETKLDVIVPIPFRFLVLDELHTIRGYNKPKKEGYWSNEVRDTKKQVIKIQSKAGVQAEGLYEDIKGKVAGAKYNKAVYIAYFDTNKALKLGCLLLSGTAMSDWFDFCKGKNVKTGAIKIEGTRKVEDGEDVYYSPIFNQIECKPETEALAIELDKALQVYLKAYFSKDYVESQNIEGNRLESAKDQAVHQDDAASVKSDPAITSMPDIDDDLPF